MDLFPETQIRCATFKKWKAEVENHTSLKIKCLRSDNGGEYNKSEFKAFMQLREFN